MKKQKVSGITLVSLVITIIILLILAGVVLVNVIGNNSAIEHAEQAKLTEEQLNKKEALEQALIKYNSGNYTGDGDLRDFLEKELNIASQFNGKTNIAKFTDLDNKEAYVIHDYMGESVYIVSDDGFWKVEAFSNLGYLEKLEDGDVLISPKSGEEFNIDKDKYAIIESSDDLKDISFNIPANTEVSIKLLSDMIITNEGLERAAINLNSKSILNLEIYGTVEVTSKYGKDPERANGEPGKPGLGGYAGIHVPKDATLNLSGTGVITARGGDAGDGSDAAKGDIGGSGGRRCRSWYRRKWRLRRYRSFNDS